MLQHQEAAAAATKAFKTAIATDASSDKLDLLHHQQLAALNLINQTWCKLLKKELNAAVLQSVEQDKFNALIGASPATAARELQAELSGNLHAGDNGERVDSGPIAGTSVLDTATNEAVLGSSNHISEGTAAPKSTRVSSSLLIALQQALDALPPQFRTAIPTPKPDYSILKQPLRNLELSDVLTALCMNNQGTTNAISESTATVQTRCPWCKKPFSEAIKQQTPTAAGDKYSLSCLIKTITVHLWACSKSQAQEAYSKVYHIVLSGKPCQHPRCKGKELPVGLQHLKDHISQHHSHIILQGSAHTSSSVQSCPFMLSGDKLCNWLFLCRRRQF